MNNVVKQWYDLKGNLQRSQLYRVDKDGSEKGSAYEGDFDIIDGIHVELSHVRDSRTMYNHINKNWHGVTEKIIKVYRE
jgi:hypothetical protein